MKKLILLMGFTLMSIPYVCSQSSYTFESKSATNPELTYMVTLTYTLDNTATVSRTSRASTATDNINVFVDLPIADYSTSTANGGVCLDVNVQSQNGFIYYIEEDVLVGVPNGGPSICVDCGCKKAVEGAIEGHCKGNYTLLAARKSQVNIIVTCENITNCADCRVINVGVAGNKNNGGAIIFKASSAN